MLFNSLEYIIFLPTVFLLFYLFPHRFRVFILLLASYYFYMSWNPAYIFLIITSTLIDYTAGRGLERARHHITRKSILWTSICVNLGMLIFFKYGNFFIDNFNRFRIEADRLEPLGFILPVGISFYTFQTMSYTIDVYRGAAKAERSLPHFALFVSYFPQLIAGPIERFNNIIDQLKAKVSITREKISQGCRLILYGLFMKMVIADNLSLLVDDTYANIPETHALNLIIGAVLYSFQIYCDFFGYTTIAIGTAKLFGVGLSENFKTPYLATSLTGFWRKWHITLTSWFRDYIYFPMGGNRSTTLKWILAIMTVFLVSGFWHGAQWSFVAWGALHGIVVLAEKFLKFEKWNKSKAMKPIAWLYTFTTVSLLWIFFRSPDFGIAKNYFKGIIRNWDLPFQLLPDTEMIALLGFFIITDVVLRKKNFAEWMEGKNTVLRWGVYLLLLFLILARAGTNMQPFIYFQF